MVALEEAEKHIDKIILRHMPKLKEKYKSVEQKGGTIICTSTNQDSIKLQARPDYSRRNPKLPMNSKDYQEQGGWKGLHNKFEQKNAEAWAIIVLKTTSGSTYEIAFSGSESVWDSEKFEREFVNLFLSNTNYL